MSKLAELYEERKKQYEEYMLASARYQALVENYLTKINKSEVDLKEKFESLPEDIKECVIMHLPNLNEPCTTENARERIEQWRRLYTALESKGMQLLGGGSN